LLDPLLRDVNYGNLGLDELIDYRVKLVAYKTFLALPDRALLKEGKGAKAEILVRPLKTFRFLIDSYKRRPL